MSNHKIKLARVRRSEDSENGPITVIRDIFVDGKLWGYIHQQGDPSSDSPETCARYHVVYKDVTLWTGFYLDVTRKWVLTKLEKQGPSGGWLTRKLNVRTNLAPAALAKRGPPLRPFFSKVFGVTQTNPDGSDRQKIVKRCKAGEQLRLVRELDNPHDSNAVAVVRLSGEQIGYLPRDLAEEIARRLDRCSRVDVEISEITGGGWLSAKSCGVNIKITKYSMR